MSFVRPSCSTFQPRILTIVCFNYSIQSRTFKFPWQHYNTSTGKRNVESHMREIISCLTIYFLLLAKQCATTTGRALVAMAELASLKYFGKMNRVYFPAKIRITLKIWILGHFRAFWVTDGSKGQCFYAIPITHDFFPISFPTDKNLQTRARDLTRRLPSLSHKWFWVTNWAGGPNGS